MRETCFSQRRQDEASASYPSLEDCPGVPNSRWQRACGVRSSSSTWSSLRSISSRRRRIRERLLSEVMTSQHRRRRPQPGGRGACHAGAAVSRADRPRPLHSAAVGEVCWFFASSTSPSGRYRLVASPTSGDLFVCAKHLLAEAIAAMIDGRARAGDLTLAHI